MDIWEWVFDLVKELRENGNGRVADLLMELPGATCDDRHEEVDALAPEAVAAVRSLGLPWAEVFVRHWTLQSRVLHRMDATALPEALRLVDFAHDGAARGCPQAVCAVQDLTSCYEHVDSTGYVEERIAVSSETLDHIDPSWPCFECISEEKAAALNSAGRFEEALAFMVAQENRARALSASAFDGRYRGRSDALLGLGRVEEALAFLEARAPRLSDKHNRGEHSLRRAYALALLQRHDDARRAIEAAGDALRTPTYYLPWARAVDVLVSAGALPNDTNIGRTLSRMMARFEKNGVGRALVELSEIAGRLSVARGSDTLARRALSAMEVGASRLAKPLDAPALIEALRASIAASPSASVEVPDTAEAVLDQLAARGAMTPEEALAVLEPARRKFPDDASIALATCDVLRALGLDLEARASIEGYFEAHPTSEAAAVSLGKTLIALGDGEAVTALTDRLAALPNPAPGLTVLTLWWMDRREFRKAIEYGLALMDHDPRAASLVLAAARQVRDFPLSLRLAGEIVARDGDATEAHWARIVAGSALGAWAEVRDSARRLGMEIEGEGPIDRAGEICVIRFEEEDGRETDLVAQRTGPATARVLQIAAPPRAERYRDHVVFEPEAIDRGDGSDKEGRAKLYPYVATLHEARFTSYVIDGVHPGEDAVEEATDAVIARGAMLQVLSGDRYRLEPEGAAEPLKGMYAVLAVPPTLSAREAHDLLRALTAPWAEPVTWIHLAEEAGDEELAAAHREIAARLKL